MVGEERESRSGCLAVVVASYGGADGEKTGDEGGGG